MLTEQLPSMFGRVLTAPSLAAHAQPCQHGSYYYVLAVPVPKLQFGSESLA